jgi:hypothetical protein
MAKVTAEHQALYALARDLPRSDLSMAAQLEYDRLKPAWERGEIAGLVPPHDLEPALLQRGSEVVRRRRSRVVRHTVDMSGTRHIFRFHRGRHVTLGIICAAFGAAFLTGAAALPIFGWSQTSAWTAVWTEIGAVAGGLFFAWGAFCSFRSGVQVSGKKLTIVNELWMHVIEASSIRAITLIPQSLGQGADHWRPLVVLTTGRSVCIENFDCGHASWPPRPERVAVVEELRALLGVEGDDLAQLEIS